MGIIKAILAVVGAAALIFGAVPLGYGFANVGAAALFVLAGVCFLQLYLLRLGGKSRRPWEVFSGRGRLVIILRRFIWVFLGVFLVGEVALSGAMIIAAQRSVPTYTQPVTAVVLGCQIDDDQPGATLKKRLEAALIYLNRLPDAKVVVTGGQGSAEKYAEADVQAKWLIANGIDPQRIIIENRSRSTYENIKYTGELLAANGLPMEAVIFTDGFHQLRSRFYAGMNGIEASGVATETSWGLLPCHWMREQLAICIAVVVSYTGGAASAF